MNWLDVTVRFCVFIGGTIGLATIFGLYPAIMITVEMRPLERLLPE
ncbi:MAG: hypothetical protein AB7U98_04470 [Candidatus Nitrosocosmicus sp.]